MIEEGALIPMGERADAPRPVLHIILQAHIDPVWLWPWRDGFAEVLTTLQSAVDRLHEFPTARYTCSSAAFYRWVSSCDHRLFQEIRSLVDEGRWEVVGGWVVQSDTLLPNETSLRRQAQLGQRWFADHLGTTASVGYCVDSFGHPAGLPSILAAEGLRRYVFMRPRPEERADLPNLFQWEAPDGRRVLTWRLAPGYGQPAGLSADDLERRLRHQWRTGIAESVPVGTWFVGVGNHGGGPARSDVRRLVELAEANDPELPEIRLSTLSDFFADVETRSGFDDLPVVRGELVHHARGCYASNTRMKRLHRDAERELHAAESLLRLRNGTSPPAHPAADAPPPELREAWWTLCFNEFHDILPGTSIPDAYDEVRDDLGSVLHTARRIAVQSVHTMARRQDTRGAAEGVLFLVNSLPWARTGIVQVDTFVSPHRDSPITHLAAPDGTVVALQWSAADAAFGPNHAEWKKLTACVRLPAGGAQGFALAHGVPGNQPDPPRIADHVLECAAAARLIVVDDHADTWGHGVDRWDDEIGYAEDVTQEVLDDGPVFRRVRRRLEWGRSLILFDVVEWLAMDAIELVLHITWNDHYKALKLELPLDMGGRRLVARTPGAVVERPLDGDEWFWGDWLAITGQGENLVVVSDGCSSYDATGSRLRLTLLRCVPYAQHNPTPHSEHSPAPFLDEGYQRARFWLSATPEMSTAPSGMSPPSQWEAHDRRAIGLLNPFRQIIDSAHPGAPEGNSR